MTKRHTLSCAAAVLLAAVPVAPMHLRAQDGAGPSPGSSAQRSPWQGIIDGNGRAIPCRCRFDGRHYAIGETVCMSTHVGVVLTRCDFVLNNTSWIPTDTPCRPTSQLPPTMDRVGLAAHSATRNF